MSDSGKFIRRTPKSEKESVADFYCTDWRMTFSLLEYLKGYYPRDVKVLDPCAGNRDITKILRTYFNNVEAIDLFDEENPIDFLTHTPEDNYDLIIMNSPYSKKYEFIDYALKIGNTVITLFPGLALNYNLTGKYKALPSYCGQISMYPKMKLTQELINGKAIRGGTQNFCWMVFKPGADLKYKFELIDDLLKYDKKVEEFVDKEKEV